MLTLDEVEDGSYVHVHKPRRAMRGAWAKFDLFSVKLTEKTLDFFSNPPSILSNPETYIKAKSNAFLAPVPPYQDVQLCDVVLVFPCNLTDCRKRTLVSILCFCMHIMGTKCPKLCGIYMCSMQICAYMVCM